ncbi:MAG: hypothetical protein OEW04_02745 [Nitrospirota bacterium]|nr:hypothetical protein [Nitrospirota bacterium]
MCGNCFPDDIMVCPSCKRDDEAYKLGEADSPFSDLGGGIFKCLCGENFARTDQLPDEAAAERNRA